MNGDVSCPRIDTTCVVLVIQSYWNVASVVDDDGEFTSDVGSLTWLDVMLVVVSSSRGMVVIAVEG